jgi:hypothetical protein
MKTRHGWQVVYNAQGLVDSKGQVIVAADVSDQMPDQEQLVPLLEQGRENTGCYPVETVADAGYYSGANLTDTEGLTDLIVPDKRAKQKDGPQGWAFHKDHFVYDAARDVYICPQGKELPFERYTANGKGTPKQRQYRCHDCAGCPHRSQCTRSPNGRSLKISVHDAKMRAHGEKMKTERARQRMKQRAPLVEGAFGITKEQMHAHRFLLRGLENVRAEWYLLCAAFNLRKLHKAWQRTAIQPVAMAA